MLAREQRGRHHDGDLLAGKHREQARAQGDLGLAEADIAADQPVHGAAAREIVEHGIDARGLVLGLLIGEPRREFVIEPVRRGDHRRLAQLAHGGDLDQLLGDVADALLELRFPRLPADAAKPVELHAKLVRAITAQHLDVLDGQIELVAALVDHLEAIMRLAGSLDGGEADEAADAVVGVDHEVADREARDFGEHVAAGLGTRAAHQPVAEDVLLADDGEARRLEAGLERQHGEGGGRLRRRENLLPSLDTKRVADAVLGEKGGEALLGALAPAADEHALAFALEACCVRDHGVEHVAAFALAFGGEGAPLPAAEGDHGGIARGVWMLEGIEHDPLPPLQRRLPVGLGEEQALGRHGIIRRRAEGLALERLFARLVMILDLLEPLRPRVVVQRIEGHDRVRQIVEQTLQPLMEQRQPMLHALMLAPG